MGVGEEGLANQLKLNIHHMMQHTHAHAQKHAWACTQSQIVIWVHMHGTYGPAQRKQPEYTYMYVVLNVLQEGWYM